MRGLGMSSESTTGPWLLFGFVALGVAAVGTLLYFKYKMTSAIIKKHGVGSALAFEAGTTGLGMLADATRARRNGRRRPRRRG